MPREPDRYDLIVIGAGINGAAIAREAVLSGLSVGVFEQDDLGSGTSATSTRLIHGGLRYLEHAEFSLVFESLAERERLLRTAPHLVEPLGIYLPVYAGAKRKRWQVGAGMLLYDVLSAGKSLPKHRMLGRAELLKCLPALRRQHLLGGAYYYDAQVRFPERLVVENLLDAAEHGCSVKTHTRVLEILRDRGRVSGVKWRESGGASGEAHAPLIVNAAGPWVDTVLRGVSGRRLIGGTKGSHLILRAFPGAPGAAIYVEAQSDGRPFFIVPWNGLYLIGTTDERFEGEPGSAGIDPTELAYLLEETQRVLPDAAGLAEHVAYTQAGIRPLPHRVKGATGAITRRHLVHVHRDPAGLISVVGGKLTTHRALACDVLRRLRRHHDGLPRRSPTRDRPLPGGAETRDTVLAVLCASVDAPQAERLWRVYGARAAVVLERVLQSPELGRLAVPGSQVMVAELVHAIENEMAHSLVDILHRRCMAGLDADFGWRLARPAAECLLRLGYWDRARVDAELESFQAHAARHRAAAPMASS